MRSAAKKQKDKRTSAALLFFCLCCYAHRIVFFFVLSNKFFAVSHAEFLRNMRNHVIIITDHLYLYAAALPRGENYGYIWRHYKP